MPLRTNRLATAALCLLPAFGVGVHTPHANLIASFFYACDGSHSTPRVRTKYTAAARPTPRPSSFLIEVYEHGQPPARRYRLVGEVQVLASSGRSGPDELTEYAIRGARKLGGDAIVDVSLCDAASAKPKAGDVGLLYLTASVARWE